MGHTFKDDDNSHYVSSDQVLYFNPRYNERILLTSQYSELCTRMWCDSVYIMWLSQTSSDGSSYLWKASLDQKPHMLIHRNGKTSELWFFRLVGVKPLRENCSWDRGSSAVK